jgi:hypothetical protein
MIELMVARELYGCHVYCGTETCLFVAGHDSCLTVNLGPCDGPSWLSFDVLMVG